MRFSNHFLGGEALRRERFARILAQADAAAQESSTPAFVFQDLQPPSAPSLAVGDAIRLADSVQFFEQYARTLSRCYREPSSPIGQFLSQGSQNLKDLKTQTSTSTLSPQPANNQPSTLNPQHSTQLSPLNSQPSALSPQPSTLNPQPSTLNPQSSTLNPQPSSLSSQP